MNDTKKTCAKQSAMAIDNGVINRKSIEGFAKEKGSGRSTNETGAVGCLNTRFVSPSTKRKRSIAKKPIIAETKRDDVIWDAKYGNIERSKEQETRMEKSTICKKQTS